MVGILVRALSFETPRSPSPEFERASERKSPRQQKAPGALAASGAVRPQPMAPLGNERRDERAPAIRRLTRVVAGGGGRKRHTVRTEFTNARRSMCRWDVGACG